MANEPAPRVSNPPAKPLMIWDGDCHFCRLWIERWRVLTRDAIEYATSQSMAGRFPEIPSEQFKKSVVFIESDGAVFVGAEAVFRSLRVAKSRKWLSWSYDHVPGFPAFTEFAYALIARHRSAGSLLTRILWGNDVRPPSYRVGRLWFLRLLGLIYLIAFLSLWVQVEGLYGENGISPVNQFLPAAHEQVGSRAYLLLPSLCWLRPSADFLHFLCGGGAVLSFLLICQIAPALCLAGLFVFYLSLCAVGQPFLDFQWDILLLETGFLAIFFAPWKLWPGTGQQIPTSRLGLFLLKFLLFKLMFMSGVVKLYSGDDCWWDLTALDYHYWSQPLPTVFAWWADQHPEWFKKFSVAFCLIVEIIVPFFIWAPRRLRLIACGLLIFLQLAIALTGNYCFFNLLTIALCSLLIDDARWGRRKITAFDENSDQLGRHALRCRLSALAAGVVLIITLPLNCWHIFTSFKPFAEIPAAVRWMYEYAAPFRVVNGYGLFRVMTKERYEIVIEGSRDGVDWLPYEFKWKPGDLKRAPGWCAPHQPRLDWQMWFAALGGRRERPWFLRLAECLLQGKKEVTVLLAQNPFPGDPPRYLRAEFFRYRFTNADERRQSGAWWKRELVGEYLRSVSIENFR